MCKLRVFTEAKGRCALPPSRRPVAQHCLQVRGSRQAFPEDTITLPDPRPLSALPRRRRGFIITPHAPTTRHPSSLSSRASTVFRSPSSTPPASFSQASSLRRTVHELRDSRGEVHDAHDELQQSQRGAALVPPPAKTGCPRSGAITHSVCTTIPVTHKRGSSLYALYAAASGWPGGGSGGGSSYSALCLTYVYRSAAVRAATGLTLTISVKDTASSVSALLPLGPQEQPGQPAMFSPSPRCPSRSHTAKMLQSEDGCMCMGVYRYTEDVKDILDRTYTARRSKIYWTLLLGYREVEIGAIALHVGMALDVVQDLGLHKSADSLHRVRSSWHGGGLSTGSRLSWSGMYACPSGPIVTCECDFDAKLLLEETSCSKEHPESLEFQNIICAIRPITCPNTHDFTLPRRIRLRPGWISSD
ncbi:hypothetical protein VTO73DRAFT_15113 [Trametes versicolor]